MVILINLTIYCDPKVLNFQMKNFFFLFEYFKKFEYKKEEEFKLNIFLVKN